MMCFGFALLILVFKSSVFHKDIQRMIYILVHLVSYRCINFSCFGKFMSRPYMVYDVALHY
jgi:hypothetical protein